MNEVDREILTTLHQNERQACVEMDERVAEALGWTRGETTVYVPTIGRSYDGDRPILNDNPGYHKEPCWIDHDGRKVSAPMRWSSELAWAWKLHAHRPKGTTLLNLNWLDLPASDVAYLICHYFVSWKLRESR